MHAPAPVNEDHLPARNDLLHELELLRTSAFDPPLEECLLDEHELAVRVGEQGRQHGVDLQIHVRELDAVVRARGVPGNVALVRE